MPSRTKPCWNNLSTPCFSMASKISLRVSNHHWSLNYQHDIFWYLLEIWRLDSESTWVSITYKLLAAQGLRSGTNLYRSSLNYLQEIWTHKTFNLIHFLSDFFKWKMLNYEKCWIMKTFIMIFLSLFLCHLLSFLHLPLNFVVISNYFQTYKICRTSVHDTIKLFWNTC